MFNIEDMKSELNSPVSFCGGGGGGDGGGDGGRNEPGWNGGANRGAIATPPSKSFSQCIADNVGLHASQGSNSPTTDAAIGCALGFDR